MFFHRSVKCRPDGGGWRMADRKMLMIKCGWKNADDKIWMIKCGRKIVNDAMQMIKSIWRKIKLRCFLKVLFVNKPSHLIEVRSGEVQYFIFNPKRVKIF